MKRRSVRPPTEEGRHPGQNPGAAPTPDSPLATRFSLLIPLEGHRGDLIECLDGWRGQTYARDRFEVILLSSGGDADPPEGPSHPRLFDRLLCETGANLSRLYDLGAREARGQVLVFTESHCVPLPDFLDRLDTHLLATGHAGACCRTVPVSENPLARMDELLCEEGCSVFRQPEDWRKFNVQGVALSREAYLAVGGLQHRYDRFAEMLLAAALRDRGLTMSYAEGPTVRHRFRTGLRDVLGDIAAYVGGENCYRADHPGPDRIGHTFLPPFPREEHKPELLSILARTLAADLFRRGWLPGQGVLRAAFLDAACRWLRGGRRAFWAAALSAWGCVVGCHLFRWHRPWLERAYRRLWVAASRRVRLGFLLSRPCPPAAHSADWGRVAICDLADADALGLHPLEWHEGEPFRWTGRTAVIRLPLGPGEQEVVLETRGLRREPIPLDLAAYVDGTRLPGDAVQVEADCVRLRAPGGRRAGRPGHLVLACRPLRPWELGQPDERELGLPIFAVRWGQPIAGRALDRPAA